MIADTWIKTSTESVPFIFDASGTIPSGATILTTTVVVTDEDGAVVTSTLAPSGATFLLTTITIVFAAGTDGKNYLATITITTDALSTHVDTLNIQVRDDVAEKYNAVDTTLAEYKLLMRLKNDDHDALLTVLIPAMKRFVIDYTGNSFKNEHVKIYSDQLAFVAKAGAVAANITDADSLFLTHYFTSDIDIMVENSYKNDGLYHVTTAAAGKLTLASYEDLTAEAAETYYVNPDIDITPDTNDTNWVMITRVQFPRSLKLLTTSMLWHLMKSMAYDEKYREGAKTSLQDGRAGATLQPSDFPTNMLSVLSSAFKKIRVG